MSGEPAQTPLVVFIGAPGSGKTRIGKRVARMLGVGFVDTDKRIVAEHGSIADIFEQFGEPYFRTLERAAVVAALQEPVVMSVGGGAIISPETRADLAGRRVVRLEVSPDAVIERITGGKRPLLSAGIEAWTALVEARAPLYDAVTSKTWDTSTRPIERIAEDIAAWVAADAGIPLRSSASEKETSQ